MVNGSFADAAVAVGRRLTAAAHRHGRRCWWTPSTAGDPISGDLYDGSAGIAWFLAHLAAASGDPAFRSTAISGARHALAWTRAANGSRRHGLYGGIPGALWAVAHAGRLLDEPALVNDAAFVAAGLLLEPPPGERPPIADLVAGQAGTILALTALARLDARFTSLLDDAAPRLIAGAHTLLMSHALPALDETTLPWISLAHGVSGLALALAELTAATGDQCARSLMHEAFRYERAWYDRTLGVWRAPGSGAPANASWCHGTAGILLARLHAARLDADPLIRVDAGAALAALHAATAKTRRLNGASASLPWDQRNWSVCHGLMGTVDALLAAGETFAVAVHRDAAVNLAKHGCAVAGPDARWTCGSLEAGESSGLMMGLAGIGAVLFRLADPLAMPPVGLPAIADYSMSANAAAGLVAVPGSPGAPGAPGAPGVPGVSG